MDFLVERIVTRPGRSGITGFREAAYCSYCSIESFTRSRKNSRRRTNARPLHKCLAPHKCADKPLGCFPLERTGYGVFFIPLSKFKTSTADGNQKYYDPSHEHS